MPSRSDGRVPARSQLASASTAACSEFRAVDPAVLTHQTELLTKDVLDHAAWRGTTPLRTLLDLARGDTTQEQVTAAVAAALEQGLTTVRRIRTRSDEAGDRAALRIERALAAAAKP